MRIHIHDHEINQRRRILELNQHILCYPVGLHYSGVCQSQLMRGRDQWVLVQAVIDHLGQDVHAGPWTLNGPKMQGTMGGAGLLSRF
jgi:hypothetical protein